MSLEENKKIIASFLDQSGRGDFSLLTDDAEFWVAGDLPGCGALTKAGLTALAAGITDIADGPLTITPTHMIAEGDWVSAEAVGYMKLKNGKVYNNHYHLAFELRDGKIVRGREYNDTDHLRRIFFAD